MRVTKSTTLPDLAGVPAEDSPGEAAAAGSEAPGGGTGHLTDPQPQGISADELTRAAVHVDALALAALRALAAPSDPAGHMDALARLRAAVMGGHDLAIAATRHRRPEPTIEPVSLPRDPDPDPDLAAALAALSQEDSLDDD